MRLKSKFLLIRSRFSKIIIWLCRCVFQECVSRTLRSPRQSEYWTPFRSLFFFFWNASYLYNRHLASPRTVFVFVYMQMRGFINIPDCSTSAFVGVWSTFSIFRSIFWHICISVYEYILTVFSIHTMKSRLHIFVYNHCAYGCCPLHLCSFLLHYLYFALHRLSALKLYFALHLCLVSLVCFEPLFCAAGLLWNSDLWYISTLSCISALFYNSILLSILLYSTPLRCYVSLLCFKSLLYSIAQLFSALYLFSRALLCSEISTLLYTSTLPNPVSLLRSLYSALNLCSILFTN